jgi:hypothetical protein
MVAYSDFIAPEHLQVHTTDSHSTASALNNYGSLFIGLMASVVYSDKCCRYESYPAHARCGPLYRRSLGGLLPEGLHASMAGCASRG